jgi:hypothetical protein
MAGAHVLGLRVGDIVPASWTLGGEYLIDPAQRFAVGEHVVVTRNDRRLGIGAVLREAAPLVYDVMTSRETSGVPASVIRWRPAPLPPHRAADALREVAPRGRVKEVPPPRTKWTRRVPPPVPTGHAASLTPY